MDKNFLEQLYINNFILIYFRISHTRQIVSPNYSYNTQTIIKNRSTPSKGNNFENWINTIGTANNLREVMKIIEQTENSLGDEDKVNG